MARWHATDVAGDPFGVVFEQPDKAQALDYATMCYGARVFGVISVLDLEQRRAEAEAAARQQKRGDA